MESSITLHGQVLRYLEAGRPSGAPALVLLHGLGSDRRTWRGVLPTLSRHAHVLALDLLGFGASSKPRDGDYSVAAQAALVRDVVVALGLRRVSVVGHSFGGGVAMSFAYQFPERTATLGLICSGGLGRDLAPALRLAAAPSAAFLAHTVHSRTPGWLHRLGRQVIAQAGWATTAEIDGALQALDSLRDPAARDAFRRTLRDTVHWSGQRLTATDRLHLLATTPTLLIAGRRDRCIPHEHTIAAHHRLPASELAVLDAGHFPHLERAQDVARLISTFVSSSAEQGAAQPDLTAS
ncbi:MAG TPA: alpha/beta fold hydrolase [Pseudonocardia sp.]|nr:alpha/beta fold hydrolase [Pseudonocardia sp.]